MRYRGTRSGLSQVSIAALAGAIEAVREKRKLTVSQFCDEAGIGRSVYYGVMNGSAPAQVNLWRLRAWLRKQVAASQSTEAA